MAFPTNPSPGDSYTDEYGTVWVYAGAVNGWYRQTVTTPNDTDYRAGEGFVGGDLDVTGDITLDDGGTFATTLQLITPTANRTISFPDATGTVALVGGSSGQLIYNNAGAYAGDGNLTWDATAGLTLGRKVLVNEQSGFSGNLLDLQVAGSSKLGFIGNTYLRLGSGTGGIQFNGDTAAANALDDYEEGTVTLTYGASGNATGASIGIDGIGAVNTCRYTKIGRTVTMTGSVSFANGDGTTWTLGDWVQLSGLPFTLVTAGRSSGSGFMASNPETGAMGTFLVSGPTSTNLFIECVTGQNFHSTSNPVEFSITGMVL